MINPDKYYTRHQDIAWRLVEGDALLVDPRTGKIFPLNPVAARIWEMLDRQHLASEIVDVLVQEFEAPPDVIRQDAYDFIDSLFEAKLLTEEDQPDPRSE